MSAGTDNDRSFAGSIPELYDSFLVPLIFEPYAVDLVSRLAGDPPRRLLELATGTGVVTRRLALELPAVAEIVATDLNPPMLDRAGVIGTTRPVVWRQADAQHLPFADASCDAVLCQFGVMFFPDKPRAFAEARRVLRPGGRFLFNVWDRLEENDFAHVVTEALAAVFPNDPPTFMARVPHGYHDLAVLRRDLATGGFATEVTMNTVRASSRAASPRIPAIAFCQGTPLRHEIEARAATRLGAATDAAERALARRFGGGTVSGEMRAHVVTAIRC